MAKLHIPSPEQREVDRSDMYLGILAAVLVFILFGIGLQRLDEQRAAARGGGSADAVVSETGEPLDPQQVHLKAQRRRARELAKVPVEQLKAMQWTDEDRETAFRFGPREATEHLCEQMAAEIEAGTLASRWRLELEKTLDRRTEFAPWTCMVRLYLADEIAEGDLRDEMAEFWDELERHEGNARIPTSFLTTFRETRDRPENPKFYTWLRMCAYDFEYEANPACLRILHQIRPAQGGDMLLMLERHWEEAGVRATDMAYVARALGVMARNGQPLNWRVDESEELPDYDVDFRQATVGYLCRLANTPTPRERRGVASEFDDVPVMASEELRRVAEFGARGYEEKLLLRWRETCRLAFGGRGGYQGEEPIAVPLLAVWNGEVDSDPDYGITSAVERGDCETRVGHPVWYCLSSIWGGEGKPLQRALSEFFVETRYMEWVEYEEPAGSDGSKPAADEESP